MSKHFFRDILFEAGEQLWFFGIVLRTAGWRKITEWSLVKL
jgi:hypothetical protein